MLHQCGIAHASHSWLSMWQGCLGLAVPALDGGWHAHDICAVGDEGPTVIACSHCLHILHTLAYLPHMAPPLPRVVGPHGKCGSDDKCCHHAKCGSGWFHFAVLQGLFSLVFWALGFLEVSPSLSPSLPASLHPAYLPVRATGTVLPCDECLST